MAAETKVTLAEISNPYKFSVYRTAALNSTAAAYAKIPFDTKLFDVNDNFSGGTYTAPITGYYQFNARMSLATSSSVSWINLYKNGSRVARGSLAKAGAEYLGSVVSTIVQCNAGDTIEIYGFCQTAIAYETGAEHLYFNGHLLSV